MLAGTIRKRYGLRGRIPTDEQIAAILDGEGVIVDEGQPFRGRVLEVYDNGCIGLRAGLSRPWQRWLLLHGLAHHLAHVGNHLYLVADDVLARRQERHANLFAGYLLWYPLARLSADCRPPMTTYELAELAEVPVLCVHLWRQAMAAHAAELHPPIRAVLKRIVAEKTTAAEAGRITILGA